MQGLKSAKSHVMQLEINETETEIPSFTDATKQLKDFLASQDLSPELEWVFREDIIWRKQLIHVRVPLPQANESLAKSLYEKGRQRDLGIRLETLCLLDSHPCCYVWLPEDQMEAECALLLMSKFIISAPNELKRAEPVGNPVTWQAYKLFEGKSAGRSLLEKLPGKNI